MVTINDKMKAQENNQQSLIESLEGWIDTIKNQDETYIDAELSIEMLYDEIREYMGI